LPARRIVVAHVRSVVSAMEPERRLEHHAVAGGHLLVLAEMLEPRFDDESRALATISVKIGSSSAPGYPSRRSSRRGRRSTRVSPTLSL